MRRVVDSITTATEEGCTVVPSLPQASGAYLHCQLVRRDVDLAAAPSAVHDPQAAVGVGVGHLLPTVVVKKHVRSKGGEEAAVVVPPDPTVLLGSVV
jgi:hypothetical protein